MKETDFIRQNHEKWADLEVRLKRKGRSRDHTKLGDSFVQLSEDLSYAQTYYPRRTVRVFLNALSQRLYKKVFNARQHNKNSRFRFWSHGLPTALWESRKELLIALAVFALAIFIGVVSSRYEDSFAAQILGERYINMTEENIAKGDPMGVYKDADAVEMFFRIMYNNLQVSVITFVLGILFGVGTIGILMRNGIMLGVFQFFFFQRGLGFESFLTIWQHGTIEIASIVVAGGAGLVLGRSIVFPGTLPRSVSLKFGMLRGLKILLGVAPLIVLAAFIESFYTRFDDMPLIFRLSTILASLAFVLGYYVYLPIKRGRRLSLLHEVEDDYSESHSSYDLKLDKLKNVGEILGDSLVIIQQHLATFMRISIIPALLLALVIVFFLQEDYESFFYFTPFQGFLVSDLATTIKEVFVRLEMYGSILNFKTAIWMWPLMASFIAFISRLATNLFLSLLGKPVQSARNKWSSALYLLTLHAIALLPFFISLWYIPLYLFVFLPASGISYYIMQTENLPLRKAFARAIRILFSGFLRHVGMIIITLLFSFLAAMLVQSPVFYILFELGNDFIGFTENEIAGGLVELSIVFVSLITFFCGIEFIILNTIMNYQSIREIKEATQLMEAIENLNLSKR
jgi:uncharacterized membrane protein SpoIIM required for sporulation